MRFLPGSGGSISVQIQGENRDEINVFWTSFHPSFFGFPLPIINPPLLHTHPSSCYFPEEASHWSIICKWKTSSRSCIWLGRDPVIFFIERAKYKFLDSAEFFNGISTCSSFPAQRSGVKKDPKTVQRGGPHTYKILKFVEGFHIHAVHLDIFKVFIHQLMHKWTVVKTLFKSTLKLTPLYFNWLF